MLYPYFLGQDVRTDRRETIAILGLEVVGTIDVAATQTAQQLTEALRRRASNNPFAIAPNSNKELIDEKISRNCDDERKECMIAIGRALHADHLLYGQITRSRGGGYQVSLKLLDVNNGQLTPWTGFLPTSDLSSSRMIGQGARMYDALIARDRASGDHDPADVVLTRAANEAFWQRTNYKRGLPLDMSNKKDREQAKTWIAIRKQLKSRRDRATTYAQRILNETVNPYVLVIEQRDGTLRPQTFPQRGNLDVQYRWLVDQPEYYAYLAMFDFTQRKDGPLHDQFSLTRREQTPVSGWYGYAPW
jgi:hypothetical protein